MKTQSNCATATSEKIRQFVFDKFPKCKQEDFKDDESLIDSGVVDSLGMLDLVTFVEEDFGIVVQDVELTPENFESIAALSKFVDAKQEN